MSFLNNQRLKNGDSIYGRIQTRPVQIYLIKKVDHQSAQTTEKKKSAKKLLRISSTLRSEGKLIIFVLPVLGTNLLAALLLRYCDLRIKKKATKNACHKICSPTKENPALGDCVRQFVYEQIQLCLLSSSASLSAQFLSHFSRVLCFSSFLLLQAPRQRYSPRPSSKEMCIRANITPLDKLASSACNLDRALLPLWVGELSFVVCK